MRARREIDWVEPGENSRSCTQCYARFRRQGNEKRQPNIQQVPISIENENTDEVDVDNDEGNGKNIRNVPGKLPINQRVYCVRGVFGGVFQEKSF
ncbi:hypothetical protein JTB14_018739 [Gonioctena quinquepunctata]|nr:hypothetical protein JTB14_018739 [Gonioctena quinquepunctata]